MNSIGKSRFSKRNFALPILVLYALLFSDCKRKPPEGQSFWDAGEYIVEPARPGFDFPVTEPITDYGQFFTPAEHDELWRLILVSRKAVAVVVIDGSQRRNEDFEALIDDTFEEWQDKEPLESAALIGIDPKLGAVAIANSESVDHKLTAAEKSQISRQAKTGFSNRKNFEATKYAIFAVAAQLDALKK